MSKTTGQEGDFKEKLAAIEHERWSRWHEHAVKNWTPENVERWNRLAKMRYDELPEFSKESDRKEVMAYWPLIQEERRRAIRETLESEAVRRLVEAAEYSNNILDLLVHWTRLSRKVIVELSVEHEVELGSPGEKLNSSIEAGVNCITMNKEALIRFNDFKEKQNEERGGGTKKMNLDEAKKLFAKGNPAFVNDRFEYCKALGFLEALQCKEVKELVEALKRFGRHSPKCKYRVVGNSDHCNCGLKEAISNWKKAVGEK